MPQRYDGPDTRPNRLPTIDGGIEGESGRGEEWSTTEAVFVGWAQVKESESEKLECPRNDGTVRPKEAGVDKRIYPKPQRIFHSTPPHPGRHAKGAPSAIPSYAAPRDYPVMGCPVLVKLTQPLTVSVGGEVSPDGSLRYPEDLLEVGLTVPQFSHYADGM